MTADQRLDQLEPLISEALTVLDRHTVQLKRLDNTVGQIVTILTQQSDNIAFLLQEHIVIKTDIAEIKSDISGLKLDMGGLKSGVTELKSDVTGLKSDVTELKSDVAGLKSDVSDIKQSQQAMQADFGTKLDLILSKLA